MSSIDDEAAAASASVENGQPRKDATAPVEEAAVMDENEDPTTDDGAATADHGSVIVDDAPVESEVPADDDVSVVEATDGDAAPSDEPAAEADVAVGEASDTDVAESADADATAESEDAAADGEEAVDAEDLLEEAAAKPSESPYDRPGRWFVVHTQSGYEKKVKQNLEARISSMNMEDRIYEVVIPTEDVVEFKGGKKVVVPKKVFPGYLLVRCQLNDDSWYVVRNTPGVTGFVGAGNKPSPLRRKDVENFLKDKDETEEVARKGRPRLQYELGETVRVKEGPFADFSGEIVEINEDQLKIKVLVNIFGRETPVELEFAQVARL